MSERETPRNGAIHIAALTLQKLADALIDPKLVLPSLLLALGAPAWIIGALVPVREAGSLLPQLAMAPRIAAQKLRKRVWAAGAATQGAAAIGMALAGWALSGVAAGLAILAALSVLALARAAGSLAHKDALARTVPKGRRGHVSGLAASIGAGAGFLAAAALAAGVVSLTPGSLSAMLAVAGLALIAGAVLFLRLDETPQANPAPDKLAALWHPLRDNAELRLFIATRAALAATAFAPPFIVMLAAAEGRGALDQLGPLYLASTLAAVLASWFWGRLSDRSSRVALAASGGLAGAALIATGTTGLAGQIPGGVWGAAIAVFVSQCGYQGVRMARKLHLTDMTNDENRAAWTALANTALGAVLLAGGAFGIIASVTGPAAVLVMLGLLSAVGAAMALRLAHVQ
ncbi:MAG: MFS transporter [Paracoccus sp. (in: a-proteobacteria)]|nr:MFS transporter [Paracoccus sp. (in: a-proteobacteria)]